MHWLARRRFFGRHIETYQKPGEGMKSSGGRLEALMPNRQLEIPILSEIAVDALHVAAGSDFKAA